jgi:hypothetical protein
MNDQAESSLPSIQRPIRFTRRPLAIAPDFRKDWKIALLLLILELSSRSGKSSLKRLHVVHWAVRTSDHQHQFEESRNTDVPLFKFKVRFEPAFSRAIELAEAQKLVEWVEGDRVQITELGRSFAKQITKHGVMQNEVAFLERIGKSISETQAMKLITGSRIA